MVGGFLISTTAAWPLEIYEGFPRKQTSRKQGGPYCDRYFHGGIDPYMLGVINSIYNWYLDVPGS